MSLAIIGIVYPVIFITELPDKTMFASLALATRGRPSAVWAGAAAAFAVHVMLAVTVGGILVTLLPGRAVQMVAAVLFLAAAVWKCAARHQPQLTLGRRAGNTSSRRTAPTAFAVIFLAEWGDLTQILTASLAAHYHAPLAVGLGLGWRCGASQALRWRPEGHWPGCRQQWFGVPRAWCCSLWPGSPRWRRSPVTPVCCDSRAAGGYARGLAVIGLPDCRPRPLALCADEPDGTGQGERGGDIHVQPQPEEVLRGVDPQ